MQAGPATTPEPASSARGTGWEPSQPAAQPQAAKGAGAGKGKAAAWPRPAITPSPAAAAAAAAAPAYHTPQAGEGEELQFGGAHILEIYDLSNAVKTTQLEQFLARLQPGAEVPPVLK